MDVCVYIYILIKGLPVKWKDTRRKSWARSLRLVWWSPRNIRLTLHQKQKGPNSDSYHPFLHALQIKNTRRHIPAVSYTVVPLNQRQKHAKSNVKLRVRFSQLIHPQRHIWHDSVIASTFKCLNKLIRLNDEMHEASVDNVIPINTFTLKDLVLLSN